MQAVSSLHLFSRWDFQENFASSVTCIHCWAVVSPHSGWGSILCFIYSVSKRLWLDTPVALFPLVAHQPLGLIEVKIVPNLVGTLMSPDLQEFLPWKLPSIVRPACDLPTFWPGGGSWLFQTVSVVTADVFLKAMSVRIPLTKPPAPN